MSCYLPMLEKLKAVVIAKESSGVSTGKIKSIQDNSVLTADIQKIYPTEKILTKSESNLPKRDPAGLTFTQNIGVFPRHVALEIRHAHPTLGLTEVAQVRKHSENPTLVQCQNQNYTTKTPPTPKGVLSLGLPPQMVPRGFSTMAKKPHPGGSQCQSAPSEAICHYYETLNPKYANVVSMQRQKV